MYPLKDIFWDQDKVLGLVLWTQLAPPSKKDSFDLFSAPRPRGSAQLSLFLQKDWLAAPNLNLPHAPPGRTTVGHSGRD